MEKYKFRGKAIMPVEELDRLAIKHCNGWVYGNLVKDDAIAFIVGGIADWDEGYLAHEWWVRVDINTIGQFVGLYDDNGDEIYESDIVEVLDKTETKTSHRSEVTMYYNGIVIKAHPMHDKFDLAYKRDLSHYCDYGFGGKYKVSCKIVGNIFEDPELLEEEI